MISISSKEKQILSILQSDATRPLHENAEILAVSKSAVWRAVRRFEDMGIIEKRVTLLNQRKLGLPLTVYVSVRTNQHNAQWSARFKEVVESIPEVMEVHRMSGDLDYLIKAVVSDIDGYDRVYQSLIKADLFDVSSSFVMETLKTTTELPLHVR
jgi:Lrp/AsnC family transcriptional regulator